MTDTSREAVERAAQVIRGNGKPTVLLSQAEAVALLDRAEAAEAKAQEHLEARQAADAKLATTVGALRLYSCDDGCNDCPEQERDRVSCGWTARAALEEIEGENHE